MIVKVKDKVLYYLRMHVDNKAALSAYHDIKWLAIT